MALLVILGDPGRGGGTRRECFSGDFVGSGLGILKRGDKHFGRTVLFCLNLIKGFLECASLHLSTRTGGQVQVETDPDYELAAERYDEDIPVRAEMTRQDGLLDGLGIS